MGAELPLAECKLDLTGFREQRERYRALGRHVVDVERRPGALEVRFDDELDSGLLEETLRIERDCCPFFRLAYDSRSRRLSASVSRGDQEPALDAIGHALGARS